MDRANCRGAQLEMGDVHKVESAISDKNHYVILCLKATPIPLVVTTIRSRSSGAIDIYFLHLPREK